MEKTTFDNLVQQLTSFAKEYPERYKFRVLLLTLLGYGYVLASIILLFAGLLALIYFAALSHHVAIFAKFIIGLAIVNFLVLNALWVRLPPPEGVPLSRKEAEPLFELLDDIRTRLKGPKIHQVLLDNDFNACIMQQPRLGVFGWQKNYLVIGLPFMHALSPEQFTAVLAHEYGHLSGAHGKFSAWIYRVRQSWYRLMDNLTANESWALLLFRRFFNWYIPFFSAYTFVLARANEYEADRSSADIVGTHTAAAALVNSSIQGELLDEYFWKKIYKMADKQDNPATIYPLLPNFLQRNKKQLLAASEQYLQQTLKNQTDSTDTHPSLQDRLAALGEEAKIPAPFEQSAAQVLLQPHLESLQAIITVNWQSNIATKWHSRHQYVQQGKQQLQALQAKSNDELNSYEKWQLASLTSEFVDDKQAFPLYKKLLTDDKDDKFANAAYFQMGRILLDNQQEKGIACIEKAVKQNEDLLLEGYQIILNYLHKQNAKDETLLPYQQRIEERQILEQQAYQEREFVIQTDVLLSHQLSEEKLKELAAIFAIDTTIKQVYIGRKNVKIFPDRTLHVIGIKRTFNFWRSRTKNNALLQNISEKIDISGEYFLFVLTSEYQQLEDRLHQVENGLIYDKHCYQKGLLSK